MELIIFIDDNLTNTFFDNLKILLNLIDCKLYSVVFYNIFTGFVFNINNSVVVKN